MKDVSDPSVSETPMPDRSSQDGAEPTKAELIERLSDWARTLDQAPQFLAKGQFSRIYEAAFRTAADIRQYVGRFRGQEPAPPNASQEAATRVLSELIARLEEVAHYLKWEQKPEQERAVREAIAVLATPPASPAEPKTPEQIAEAIASDDYGDETNGYASWMSNHSCGPYYGCCGGGKEIDRAELARAIAAAIRSTSAVPHSAFIRDHEDGRPLAERTTTDQARTGETSTATDGAATASTNLNARGWQPIETAPKTSRHILVWTPANQCVSLVSWDENPWGSESRWVHSFGGRRLIDAPTHWMPLPAPPTTPHTGGFRC